MLEIIKRGIPKCNFLGIQGFLMVVMVFYVLNKILMAILYVKAGTFRYHPSPLKIQSYSVIQKKY